MENRTAWVWIFIAYGLLLLIGIAGIGGTMGLGVSNAIAVALGSSMLLLFVIVGAWLLVSLILMARSERRERQEIETAFGGPERIARASYSSAKRARK